jgi:hypothetical protein
MGKYNRVFSPCPKLPLLVRERVGVRVANEK